MILPYHPGKHLSYCSNIHPGEKWVDVFDQLKKNLPKLKQRISPDEKFGIGLRLSAIAAEELLNSKQLDIFQKWLEEENLYVFTLNGFPYGSFHGKKVKDDVYKPDWRTTQRYEYTLNLIDILATLLPDGSEGSISTSPISYKYWNETPEMWQDIFKTSTIFMSRLAYKMDEILKITGKEIHLNIEPEPDCLLENSRETIQYFENSLLPDGGQFLVDNFKVTRNEAEDILLKHIGVCYDTCHFALEYENPADTIRSFQKAGIRIGKTQISAALKVKFGDSSSNKNGIAEKLKQFVEPVYLHQVLERQKNGAVYQYRDLPDALSNIHKPESEEWRIHFHVPIFVEEFDDLQSTQDEIAESLRIIFDENLCSHFEIETYTFDVLPDDLKSNLTDSIEREYRWVLNFAENHV